MICRTLLTAALLFSSAEAVTTHWKGEIGGALPIGDFASTERDGDYPTNPNGFSAPGIAAGVNGAFMFNKYVGIDLNPMIAVNFQKKDALKSELNASEITGAAPRFMVPLLAGVKLNAPLGKSVSLFGDALCGANLLWGGSVEASYAAPLLGSVSSMKAEPGFSGAFAFAFGGGAEFGDFSISAKYLQSGEHAPDVVTSGKVLGVSGNDTAVRRFKVQQVLIMLGWEF